MPATHVRRRVAVCVGTFDPPTNGHLETIERAARLFDEVIVAVYAAPANKQPLFTVDERKAMLEAAVAEYGLANVRVRSYTGLTVELAREEGAIAIVKGMRAVSDFDYEFQMAHMNAQLAPEIETVMIMASAEYSFLSSTLVREVAKLGGDVRRWVPRAVAERLRERFGQRAEIAASVPDAEGGSDRMGGFVVPDDRVR